MIASDAIIIGWGVVGKSTSHALGIKDHFDIEDWGDPQTVQIIKDKNIFFLCVPTPTINKKQDLGAIIGWLHKININNGSGKTIVIRSTILPGTTDMLAKKYPDMNLVHMPEFLTEKTALRDAKNPELLVIGARDILVKDEVEKFCRGMNVKKLILCDPTTAEMIKYAMNSFFALKVIYSNQLWDVCKKVGANYGDIADALESHKWGSRNGWDVWRGGKRGYGGKCLPKDIEAFVNKFDLPLIKKVYEINKELCE